jgi:cell wall-associated NlpC family hydrolase
MKPLLLISFLFLPALLLAQEKELRKITRLYQKEKDEKVISLAKRYQQDYPKRWEFYFMESKSGFRLYSKSRPGNEKQLNTVLEKFKKAHTLMEGKSNAISDPIFILAFRKTLADKIFLYKDKTPKKAASYTEFLAANLGDTIQHYWVLHPPAVVEVLHYDTLSRVSKTMTAKDFFQKPRVAPNRDSVLNFANRFVGTPYKWAGETPKGFDCSGYVLYVMRKFGYDFYHQTNQIAKLGMTIPISAARKGDIVVFGSWGNEDYRVSHVGIMAENEPDSLKVIHCVNRGVCVDDLKNGYWKDYVLFVRRIID